MRVECDLEGEALPVTVRDFGFRAGLNPEARKLRRRRNRRDARVVTIASWRIPDGCETGLRMMGP